jgi:hypothetical protein
MPVLLTAFAFSLWFLRNALSEAVNGILVALALAWSAVFAFTFGLGFGLFIPGITSP